MLKVIVSSDAVVSRSAALFRQERHGMGWTVCSLAKTLLVSEAIVVQWESGERPIPAKILEWVEMYVPPRAKESVAVVTQEAAL